ncbi:putative inactive purple acid phosphatase 29 -like protein [Gossypium arboreum]|uniref:Putative inactive purple acid phosphatase 29-like protein n=1 Tax=Gossypium arboreum TaxID=29729 RepID=A0A0B0MPS8_GOSAR|nr:putative inactive purple acid phosphatase 29 -like protein [Gossypium arboreum]
MTISAIIAIAEAEVHGCSALNTSLFIQCMIEAEKPNLIVFTGDNIFGSDTKDSAKSLNAAFAPAIAAEIPWAAFLLSVAMAGSKPSQQLWFQRTSTKLQNVYMRLPMAQKSSVSGLVYFHIPLPEFASFDVSNFTGVRQEGITLASINSGFFTTMVEAGDVKVIFTGHDHLNDFCGQMTGIQLSYAGGFGYHAYGKVGWSRRARVVVASLEKTDEGGWGAVRHGSALMMGISLSLMSRSCGVRTYS